MLTAASRGGQVKGLVPHLVEGGLTHLQYADDIIAFVENSEPTLDNLKLLLFCYEVMIGMKINYGKSELFVVGIEQQEHQRMDKINCRVGSIPLIYLGLPVSEVKISNAQLAYVAEKAGRRLSSWKCDNLSYGGKQLRSTRPCPVCLCIQWGFTYYMKATTSNWI